MALYATTVKRFNGTTYDELYPKTIIAQVNGLATALSNKVETSALGSTVATLTSGTIPASQLPSWLVSGDNRVFTAVSASTFDMGTAVATLISESTSKGIEINQLNGSQWQITGATGCSVGWTSGTYTYVITGEEGDSTSPIQLEATDIIIFNRYVATGETYYFSVVNNKYGQATPSEYGVTQLSSSTSVATTGNNVVTDGILHALMGTSGTTIAYGNHTHTGVYQPVNSKLTDIGNLAATDSNIIVGNGTTWVAESGSTARTSLGLAIGTNVQAYSSTLDTVAAKSITTLGYDIMESADGTEVLQLIGGAAITELANRPHILYNTTTGAVAGDYIFSDIVAV